MLSRVRRRRFGIRVLTLGAILVFFRPSGLSVCLANESDSAATAATTATSTTAVAPTLPVCTGESATTGSGGCDSKSNAGTPTTTLPAKNIAASPSSPNKVPFSPLRIQNQNQVSPGWHRMTPQEMVKAAQDACLTDTKLHCAGVKNGNGRIARCLKEHEKQLKPECRQYVGSSQVR